MNGTWTGTSPECTGERGDGFLQEEALGTGRRGLLDARCGRARTRVPR